VNITAAPVMVILRFVTCFTG